MQKISPKNEPFVIPGRDRLVKTYIKLRSKNALIKDPIKIFLSPSKAD